ncbi:thioesterase family protein [Kutzneria viridogrisea]|uniref:Thioesterase family protein n=1 Tax=Kutzneria viridogrisea TaxID=47990 RepID=A0ABR6BH83_9PSEU|nr:hypothetical protein [Kutzneria viridogrisea]
MNAFYEQLDDNRFAASEHSRGPWDANAQHGGPPSALLGRAVESRPGARPGFRLARMTFEISRPVPIAELVVSTRVLKSGRSAELVEAELAQPGGDPLLRARALLVRVAEQPLPAIADPTVLPGPDQAEPKPFFPVAYEVGYHNAMEWRFVSGAFQEPGPATCWLRMRMPLVAGEQPSPLVRVLIAADSGNGVSTVLDWRTHTFINPDLTVHLHRYPVGEWVCLDARTTVDAGGIGLADTALHDEKGVIGRGAQSLLVTAR